MLCGRFIDTQPPSQRLHHSAAQWKALEVYTNKGRRNFPDSHSTKSKPAISCKPPYMGYKKTKTAVSSGKETIISMASTAFVLKEVQVKGSRITGRDTISFDLTRFANERDNSLKDVLKKLPGVDIEKNGRINYNGKPINRFTVEGLDLTGGKYNQLEENIKAKDVKRPKSSSMTNLSRRSRTRPLRIM